jgi:DNA modification methylase
MASVIDIQNVDGLNYLDTIPNQSIDLILTDPPYIISKETGMNTHYNKVKENDANDVDAKNEAQWETYKAEHDILDDEKKDLYMKYGTTYGKKYCVKTDFGTWDSEFSMELLEQFIVKYYAKLKKGGTIIIFFDLWKITPLKEMLEKHKFKQIRMIEWIKTNPQPLNSSVNYLTNCREIALVGVKGSKPTFHSKYDNGIYDKKDYDDRGFDPEIYEIPIQDGTIIDPGIYKFPIQGGKKRFHPTQKSLDLFKDLIKKHSNENDVVLDTFLGGGTTALACKLTNRQFKGCEISTEYFDQVMKLI